MEAAMLLVVIAETGVAVVTMAPRGVKTLPGISPGTFADLEECEGLVQEDSPKTRLRNLCLLQLG